jgi:hypothetical protein
LNRKPERMIRLWIIFLPQKPLKNGAFQNSGCKNCVKKTVFPVRFALAGCGLFPKIPKSPPIEE